MTAKGPETPDDKSDESVRTPPRMCPEAPGDDCLSLRKMHFILQLIKHNLFYYARNTETEIPAG